MRTVLLYANALLLKWAHRGPDELKLVTDELKLLPPGLADHSTILLPAARAPDLRSADRLPP